ncbi:MAG: urease accessory UreF family protein [Mycobacterium sp.]
MTGLSTLLGLSDSRLPTGGHVHSGGMEEAVADKLVTDVVTLEAFLRRRIRTSGLVAASVAVAVQTGALRVELADREFDARTPAPAARASSRAQGRGLLRLARRVWPNGGALVTDWSVLGRAPHLAVVAGVVGETTALDPEHTALVLVYTTMTGSATAAQRLLALDPADVAAVTFALSETCDRTAAEATTGLADLSDPLLDLLAQRHAARERPLFMS